MSRVTAVFSVALVAAAASLCACHSVTTTSSWVEGPEATPKECDAPIDILSGRPNRPYRSLGTVEVRVDRGTALKDPTLADAIPALEQEARYMGADAVMLTHEEFTSWFDKGEDASPIHDLERQESWYITEKARYISGIAVVYTGPACAAPLAAPRSTGAPGTYGPGTYTIPGPGSRPVPVGPGASPSTYGAGTYMIPAPGQPPVPVSPQTPAPGTVSPAPSTTPTPSLPPPPPPPTPEPPPPPPPTPGPTLPEGPIELPPEAPPPSDGTKPGGATVAKLPPPHRATR